MKNRQAKKIVQCFPLLLSPDLELIYMGLDILKNLPIIVNLNKHYTWSSKYGSWPGWDDNIPRHLDIFKFSSYSFNKFLFENTRKCTEYELYKRVYIIICWLYHITQLQYSKETNKAIFSTFLSNTSWQDGKMEIQSPPKKKVKGKLEKSYLKTMKSRLSKEEWIRFKNAMNLSF